MLFKNKETNTVWDIKSPVHIKRCQNDPKFEKVPAKKTPAKKTTPKKTTKSTKTTTDNG